MTIDWTPLADLIETNDRFLVTTHVRPDGDALGSEVGIAGLLRQKGKDVRVVNSSPTPPRYDFLDPELNLFEHFGHKVQPGELADRQVAVILDLSSWNQLGDMAGFIRQFPGPRVVIDHHVSEDDLGARVFKDSTAEATGILIMKAISALRGSYTPEVANALLTAIAMDTGWFRHSNTGSGTLRAVAELIDAGAKVDALYRQLFERNTLGRLKLMGQTLSGMRTDLGGKIAYATISKDDLLRTQAIPPDSEDLVDFTVSMRGVEVGMLFIEQARGGVKVSFRRTMVWIVPVSPQPLAAADIEKPQGPPFPGPCQKSSTGFSRPCGAHSKPLPLFDSTSNRTLTRCLIDCVSLPPENLTRRRGLPPPKTLGSSSPPSRFERGSKMTRRDFFRFATIGLGTLMGLLLAVPGVAYIISPLRNKGREESFETLTRLKQLELGVPRAFAIIEERRDAWVKYPREPVGSVWLIRQDDGANPRVVALSSECPHLGCAVNLNADGKSFLCPCHTSAFDLDGKPKNQVPPRAMDRLQVELTGGDDPDVRVKFQRFRTQSEEQIPLV